MFVPVTTESMLGRASEKGLLSFNVVNIRDFSLDKHRKTDDTPFGGGAGMVMTPQPAFDALKSVGAESMRCIYMSPRGRILDGALAAELAQEQEICILCGHYEGVDQRILDAFRMEEISIGDYILTGGELAAMVLVDAFARLVPGVLGNELSPMNESIYSGLLEYDQYTKPREYCGMEVPEVLYNGNHKLISLWQFENSLRRTKKDRPDLLEGFLAKAEAEGRKFTKDEKKILDMVLSEQ